MIPLMMLNYEKNQKYSWEWLLDPLLNIHDPHQAKLRFNAPFENNTRDYSPNNYSGTVNGLTIDKKGLYSNSNNDYYALNSAAFPSGTTDFTIEFWVWVNATTITYPYIISSANYLNSGFYITCVGAPTNWNSYPDSYLSFNLCSTIGSAYVLSKTGIRGNNWYHIAIVRKGASLYMYLNGILQSKHSDTSIRSLVSSGTPKIFGEASSITGAEKGYISNVKFYNSAKYTGPYIPNFRYRGQTENYIAGLKNYNITGPVYLKKEEFSEEKDPYANYVVFQFDATISSNAKDIASNVIPTYTGTYTIPQAVSRTIYPYVSKINKTSKKVSGFIYTDGNGDRVSWTNSKYVLGTSNFTIEFWTAPYNGGGGDAYGRLLLIGTDSANGCFAVIRANAPNPLTIFAQTYSGGWSNVIDTNSGTLPNDKWSHVAITRSGGNVYTMYINGVLANTVTNGTGNNLTGNTIYIGSGSTAGTNDYHGRYANFRITKGIVRYTSNFDPQISFPSIVRQ